MLKYSLPNPSSLSTSTCKVSPLSDNSGEVELPCYAALVSFQPIRLLDMCERHTQGTRVGCRSHGKEIAQVTLIFEFLAIKYLLGWSLESACATIMHCTRAARLQQCDLIYEL